MAGSDDIAIATVHCIVFIVNIVGNSLVCAIIKRNRNMRQTNINYVISLYHVKKVMFSTINLHPQFKDVRVHCYCASFLRTKIHMHPVRAPSTKVNNDRADGHCYSLDLTPHCPKMNKTSMQEVKKISRLLSTGHGIVPSCGCKVC